MGVCLRRAGYPVVAMAAHSLASARRAAAFIGAGKAFASVVKAAGAGRLILLGVPDDRIEPICRQIADGGGFCAGQTVVHFSGLHSSRILSSAAACGAAVASCHPMQTFATAEQAVHMIKGTYFTCEGDAAALRVVRPMVRAVGGRLLAIPTEGKVPYHVGAVIACNYLVALLEATLSLYEGLGVDRRRTMQALKPLLEGTLANVSKLGTSEALTGPIARGDAGVVEAHLTWLRRHRPDLVPAYEALGRLALDLARRKGELPPEADAALDNLLPPGEERFSD